MSLSSDSGLLVEHIQEYAPMTDYEFQSQIFYSQFCIFCSCMSNPHNHWSNRSFAQGFSWRPGSVAFRTIAADGVHSVLFSNTKAARPPSDNSIRVFRVPFETANGTIEMGGIMETEVVQINPGHHCLQFELFAPEKSKRPLIYVNISDSETGFQILRADSEIFIEGDLVLDAEPEIDPVAHA